MYGIRQCNRIFFSGEIGAFFTEIFFQISVVILNSNLHYQIFKFVIDNSDISLNCLQHIQKRRNFDAKVTCHQPICLLLHAILSGVGVLSEGDLSSCPEGELSGTLIYHSQTIQLWGRVKYGEDPKKPCGTLKPHFCFFAHRAQSTHCTACNTQSALD